MITPKNVNVNFLSHEIVVTASAQTEEHLIALTAQNGKQNTKNT